MSLSLLAEAFVVGLILLIVAIPVMTIQEYYFPDKIGAPHKYWISTIIIGVITHLLCEFSGVYNIKHIV